MVVDQRVEEGCRFFMECGVGVIAEYGGLRSGEGGFEESVVANFGGAAQVGVGGGEEIVEVEVFDHASASRVRRSASSARMSARIC